ncbi:MAG: MATE family efflux transporter [Clostridiales bacterium]|nr:MATE family efflux transporter [Clostridiales bacterium]
MAEKENKLGTAPVGKLLTSLAIPCIAAQVVNLLYNIVDRIYIGHIPEIGAAALTGVGVTFPIIMIISAFSALVGMGGAPRASIKMGQKDNDGAEKILGSCLALSIVLALVLIIIFELFGRQLLLLFGASDKTIPYGWNYMSIYVLGTFFVIVTMGLNNFISTQGFAKTSMLTVIIGAVINIILDPVFIFVFNMGVQGAALATILSQAISCIWVLRFLTSRRTILKIRARNIRLRREVLLPVIALGVSPFIMQSTESLLNICFNSSLQRYGGDMAVGAMTILSSIMQFFSLPIMGLAQGAQPIISFNYGARNKERVQKAFRLLFVCAVIFSTAFWLVNMLAPGLLVSLFASTDDLQAYASWALRIYLAAAFMMGIQNSCQQTFVAIGEAKISLFLALLRKVLLLIPLIFILPLFLEDKVFAVFLAEPIADFLAAATTFTCFKIKSKKVIGQMQER